MSYTNTVVFAGEKEFEKFKAFFDKKEVKTILKNLFSRESNGFMLNLSLKDFYLKFKEEIPDVEDKKSFMEEMSNLDEQEREHEYEKYFFANSHRYIVETNFRNSTVNLTNLYIWLATKSSEKLNGKSVFIYDGIVEEIISIEELNQDLQNNYKKIIADKDGLQYVPEVNEINVYKHFNATRLDYLKTTRNEIFEQGIFIRELNKLYLSFEQEFENFYSKKLLKNKLL